MFSYNVWTLKNYPVKSERIMVHAGAYISVQWHEQGIINLLELQSTYKSSICDINLIVWWKITKIRTYRVLFMDKILGQCFAGMFLWLVDFCSVHLINSVHNSTFIKSITLWSFRPLDPWLLFSHNGWHQTCIYNMHIIYPIEMKYMLLLSINLAIMCAYWLIKHWYYLAMFCFPATYHLNWNSTYIWNRHIGC